MRLFQKLTWGVALASCCWVMAQQCPPPAPGSAFVCPGNPSCPTPTVAARENIIDNAMVGEVLVGETVVMRLRAPLAGYTPVARATMVAGYYLGSSSVSAGKEWAARKSPSRRNSKSPHRGPCRGLSRDRSIYR